MSANSSQGDPAPAFEAGTSPSGIMGRDWASTPLGPPQRWLPSLRTAAQMVLASPFPMVLAWGPELITIHNDAYRPLLGGRPDAIGRPFLEVWSDVHHVIAPLIARAMAGETCRFDSLPFTLIDGDYPEERFFDFSYSPVADESGTVVGMLNIAYETTAQVLEHRRHDLRLALEEELRTLADPSAIMVVAVTILGRHLGVDRVGYAEIVDDAIVRTAGSYAANGVAPLNEDFPIARFGAAMVARQRQGITEVSDDLAADPQRAGDVWAAIDTRSVVSVPLVRDGRFVAALYVNIRSPRRWSPADVALIEEVAARTWDAVERARAEAELRESEERLRVIVENARDYAIFRTDQDGLVTDWRVGAENVFGYTRAEMIGRSMDILYTPEDLAQDQPARERRHAAEHGKADNVRWHVCKDQRRVFIQGIASALRDESGRLTGFLKIGQDTTERHAAGQRQELLLAELQHRVRNILAMIRSVVRRTAATTDTVEDYYQHLDGRITAMARTQGLLTRTPGAGVDLQNIILDELDGQAAQQRQFTLAGPDVSLAPKAAEVLTLAIHELATNAIKYGALAVPDGLIEIRWTCEDRDGRDWLRLVWTERRVDIPQQPRRRGFGTELVERRVPYELQGMGRMELTPEGLVATIEFPLLPGESVLQPDAGRLTPNGGSR